MPRGSSEKSPCVTCIPGASDLCFRPQGAKPKPVRFFLPQGGGILSGHERGSRSQRSLSRLLPGSSDGVREWPVSFQTEGNQRVILVHGVVPAHSSREDRTAEAYALVSLYEIRIRRSEPSGTLVRLSGRSVPSKPKKRTGFRGTMSGGLKLGLNSWEIKPAYYKVLPARESMGNFGHQLVGDFLERSSPIDRRESSAAQEPFFGRPRDVIRR
jgi:hypothetical protein